MIRSSLPMLSNRRSLDCIVLSRCLGSTNFTQSCLLSLSWYWRVLVLYKITCLSSEQPDIPSLTHSYENVNKYWHPGILVRFIILGTVSYTSHSAKLEQESSNSLLYSRLSSQYSETTYSSHIYRLDSLLQELVAFPSSLLLTSQLLQDFGH